jgi:hypothetical protein
MRDWRIVDTCCHQTCVVRHVDHEFRAELFGDFGKLLVVDFAGIGARPGDDHLGLVFLGQRCDLIEVDAMVFRIDPVGVELVELATDVQRHPVRQVTPLGKIQSEDDVAGLELGEVDGHVGLRARVRLYVGVFGPEKLFGPVDGDRLDDIDVFTSTVVSFPRIAFRIFVGQNTPDGLHHWKTGVVLASDHLETLFLASGLVFDDLPNAWVLCS